MHEAQPAILIIVGISGDLAQRKLLPAIRQIASAGALPHKFRIVGISRQARSAQDIAPGNALPEDMLDMFQMDVTDAGEYERLTEHLQHIEQAFGEPAQRLFYLSVPPQVSQPIVTHLGTSGLAARPHTKLLLEKPFGVDLASAEALVQGIRAHFSEDQVYRIDHYLAKEMVQNMIVFRQNNALFRRTWNKDFIERIEIIASEAIGIEGRATFYEQTGALRDVVQSHLLQLAAVTLMNAPAAENWSAIPQERLRALQQLRLAPGTVTDAVVRGQYRSYQTEVANPHSPVETFVSLNLESTDPAWHGVPIVLTTGKALDRKTTEVRLQYRDSDTHETNRLVLRIQPNEGAAIDLWTKEPGYEHKRKRHSLHFTYGEHYATLPEAYERVLVDAMRSDHSLFTSGDEVLASWHILAPVQAAWDMDSDDLIIYETGADPTLITQTSRPSTHR